MSQSSDIKAEINRLLDLAMNTQADIKIDKHAIYDLVQKNTNAPRPTIRRIARDVRNDLQSRIDALSGTSRSHRKIILERVAHR